MSWISFKTRKPQEGGYLITASTSKEGIDTESWKNWKNSNLKMGYPLTHWWDGEPNFDLAISKWWE